MYLNGLAPPTGAVIYNEPSSNWKIVASGDYDGSGKGDLMWQNTVTGQVYLMRLNLPGVTPTGSFIYTESDTNWKIQGP
jgi:hypothetical protein